MMGSGYIENLRYCDTMKAVVIFSGGIDSACVVARLAKRYDIYGVTFQYGQKARQETEAASYLAGALKIKEHHMVDISFMRKLYGDSNVLTGQDIAMPSSFEYSIVVPIRNAIFLSIATAWAYSIGAELVAYGAHIGDSKYPDCRPAFADALADALNLGEKDGIDEGIRESVRIWSPYKEGMTKSQIITDGLKDMGNLLFEAWSCYTDSDTHCGVCESCQNRRAAFDAAGISDKTIYQA